MRLHRESQGQIQIPGDTDRAIGGGDKLPAVKDVPAVEMTVEAEGAFMCGATDTRDGEDTAIDGEGARVCSDMARPDSDGPPLKAKEEPNDKRATTDCDRASTETDGNTGEDDEIVPDGVEKLYVATLIRTTEKIEWERDMKTLMTKMLHKATVMLPMPTVREQQPMEMEL